MHLSAIKKQTFDFSFYFIKFLLWYNSQTWKSGTIKKKGKKASNSIVLNYIADVSVTTNPGYVYLTLS